MPGIESQNSIPNADNNGNKSIDNNHRKANKAQTSLAAEGGDATASSTFASSTPSLSDQAAATNIANPQVSAVVKSRRNSRPNKRSHHHHPHHPEDELSEYNPISKWKEPIEVPSLTLYDVHRKPHQVVQDPYARVRMPIKTLWSEFHCPVCLGYMKKTSLVMECLHRFCGECIQKCLRVGKKECPSCRINIPSRRSLRPDPNFDKLIEDLYGDIDALEKHEEEEIATLNKTKNMNNAYAESRKLGVMKQSIHRKKGGTKRKSSEPQVAGIEKTTLIDFVLRRHPQETNVDRLAREYMRATGEMPINALKKYLGKKLSYEPYSHFQALVVAGGKGVVLDDSITLSEIRKDICDVSGDDVLMVLHYRMFPTY